MTSTTDEINNLRRGLEHIVTQCVAQAAKCGTSTQDMDLKGTWLTMAGVARQVLKTQRASKFLPSFDWWVHSTAIASHVLMVECRVTGATGVVRNPSASEWAEAFHAPSKPYRFGDAARVEITGPNCADTLRLDWVLKHCDIDYRIPRESVAYRQLYAQISAREQIDTIRIP